MPAERICETFSEGEARSLSHSYASVHQVPLSSKTGDACQNAGRAYAFGTYTESYLTINCELSGLCLLSQDGGFPWKHVLQHNCATL